MREQDLQIHLRRHFIEQRQARRPRLPVSLRRLGAVGPVLRPVSAHSRPAFVQARVTGGRTTGAHLRYLTRGKGPGGQESALFGPGTSDLARFQHDAQQDPHQFRLVVMVPHDARLDRTHFIELFMAQVERDLGRPLDWLAAHHDDTTHPHTHLVLRGQDRNGRTLYMERHYLTHGLRTRASELLTWFLGPVRQQQAFIQSDRQVYDGVLRGLDDPDIRARSQGDILADARARAAQQNSPGLSGVSVTVGGETLGQWAAWLGAMQQSLAAQQQAQQAQQRGGWGYGQ
jgi:hypothetical protein